MMDVTRLSTKGQIIIPKEFRSGLEPGSAFIVSRVGDMIVLKPIEGLAEDEIEDLEDVSRAWDEIAAGKGGSYSESALFEKLS